jgi:hypothetical protein
LAAVHRTEIDGVPVLWWRSRLASGSLQATLAFGVGVRAETMETLGVTDLVATLGSIGLPATDEEPYTGGLHIVHAAATAFTAIGPGEEIVRSLAEVCRLLTDPPMDRLADAAEYLSAPIGVHRLSHWDTDGLLLHHRYGPHGPGLFLWPRPRHGSIPAATVQWYAGEHFTAGNAVLLLDGPPPAGLRLPLRPGPRADAPPARRVAPDGPRWFDAPGADVAVALRCGRDAASHLAAAALRERVRLALDAAGWQGLVYHSRIAVDADTDETVVGLSPNRGRRARAALPAARAAEVLWSEVRRAAAEPFTADEVAAAVAWHYTDSDGAPPVTEERMVLDLLHGRLPALPAGTPPAVDTAGMAAVAEALPHTALLVVPDGVRPDLPGMADGRCPRTADVPAGRTFRRPLWARFGRAERLVLAPDSVSRVDGHGVVHTVRFADAVGALVDGPARILVGRGGCVVPVQPARYPGAERVVRAIDANVAEYRRPHRT